MSKQSIPSKKESATENTEVTLSKTAKTELIKAANFLAKVPDALLTGDTEALEKGFTARATVIASMPHKETKETYFVRRNGNYAFKMQADQEIGLPYGPIPRLLLAWITTEAVRTKSRTLNLGNSLSEFLEALGIPRTGARIKALKDQMNRLFSTAISVVYESNDHTSRINMHVAKRVDLWWTLKVQDAEQPGLSESTIILDEDFFTEIVNGAVVFYMDALKALKKSPMAIDIYMWLTYKNSYGKHITSIPWESLQAQFGAEYAKDAQGKRDFKKNFLSALKKVAVVYPEARKIRAVDNGLLFVPGLPHVPKTKLNP